MRTRVEVRAPATTANLGPGFDCLGLALDIWNVVRLEVGSPGICIFGEGAESLSTGQDNLVYRAVATLFQEVGVPIPEVALTCHNMVPLARGLGSSSAVAVGGLLAANALCEEPLSSQDLLRLATSLEGHPDNVAASLLGGCQIVAQDGDALITAPVTLPQGLLRAVIFIPDQAMPTAQARSLLSPQVSREDAVFNMARVALLVNALTTGQAEYLRAATQDRLHQPQRRVLFPAMNLIFRAALDAGALGVFLSGAGSSILALARDREMTIGYEMADIADKAGVTGTVRIVDLSLQGAHVVSVE